jgi:hypothetical protein
MNIRLYRLMAPLAVLAAAAGCSGGTTNPLTPAQSSAAPATTPIASVDSTASIASPRPLTPTTGALIKNADQPVTLVARNALVTKAGATVTYTFEVATDTAFGTKVQTKANVAEGTGGQTSVTLDPLPAATDYYWHVKAAGGGTTGVFSTVFKFSVGPAIIVNAPVPIGPLTGTTTSQQPALRVTNATRSGPAGAITYKFDISSTATFATLFMTGTNTEGVNETGFIPPTPLPVNTMFFWRATAMDVANGISSPPSTTESFTTSQPSQASIVAAQLGVTLWPRAQPPGTTGNATMGSDWTVENLTSFDGVTFLNPPVDELQIFDLLDRGMDPQSAINWMNSNGYPTAAAYYPAVQVIGFQSEYLAYVGGKWSIVLKLGA